MDHGINLQIQEVKDLIVEQACELHDKYQVKRKSQSTCQQ